MAKIKAAMIPAGMPITVPRERAMLTGDRTIKTRPTQRLFQREPLRKETIFSVCLKRDVGSKTTYRKRNRFTWVQYKMFLCFMYFNEAG